MTIREMFAPEVFRPGFFFAGPAAAAPPVSSPRLQAYAARHGAAIGKAA